METPPYHVPPPVRKSNTGLIVGIILGTVALCCAGVIGGGIFAFKKGMEFVGPMMQCGFGFQEARDAMVQYANKHEGKLPSAEHWQDDIAADYAEVSGRSEKGPFKSFDPNGVWGCGNGPGRTGVAFNSDLAGKTLTDPGVQSSVLLFEISQAMKNAHEPYKPRPKETSPKMMNEPRGWITIGLSGDALMGGAPLHMQTRRKSG